MYKKALLCGEIPHHKEEDIQRIGQGETANGIMQDRRLRGNEKWVPHLPGSIGFLPEKAGRKPPDSAKPPKLPETVDKGSGA